MTSLIGAGLGARRRATQGLGAVAKMEAAENRNQMMIDQAREAQNMQTMGTGAGFGAMHGTGKVIAAKTAAKQAGTEATKQFLAANVAEGTVATAAQTAAAAEAGAAATAAATPSTLATIGTIAAPIAIGLGAAYLITKLFD